MCEKQLNPVSVAELQAKRMTRKEASLKSLVFLNLLIHPLQKVRLVGEGDTEPGAKWGTQAMCISRGQGLVS